MIQFSAFEKSYGNRLIIRAGIKLADDFYWLKGGNGSGKSTLLKSITGLIPYKGMIAVDGLTINANRQAYRLAVSYAEAEPLYPDFLTGQDILSFYTDTRKATVEQAKEIAGHLDIGSYLHNKIGTYSSGMLKKLSLALAFIGQPKLIMLDEPFITIDATGLQQLNELIKKRRNAGAKILITSHQDMKFDNSLLPVMLEIRNAELIEAGI